MPSWASIDWQSAKAVDNGLSARVATASGRRTTSIEAKAHCGDLLWMKHSQCKRRDQAILTLHVRAVRAQRLQEITIKDAEDEGIEALAFGHTSSPPPLQCAYEHIVGQMSRRTRKEWEAGELHAEIQARNVNARDIYAAWWELDHGRGSWRRNPWVWVFWFETSELWPEAALQLMCNPSLKPRRL